MKKTALVFCLMLLISCSKVYGANFDTGVKVLSSRGEQVFRQTFIKGGHTMIPAKEILQRYGYDCNYNQSKLIAIKNNIRIVIPADSNRIYINDLYYKELSETSVMNNGEMYIPLRSLQDLFNLQMSYNEKNQTVTLQLGNEASLSQLMLKPLGKDTVNTWGNYSLEDVNRDLDTFQREFGNLVSINSVGASFEGREIKSLVINKENNKKKIKVLFVGGIHAREKYGVMLCMQQINHILNNSLTGTWGNYDLNYILDNVELHFIPTINPDGLNIVTNGIAASKNYDQLRYMPLYGNDSRWWKANARGVNLNQNFDDGNWEARYNQSKGPSSERYKGDSPNSEPETKALIDYCKKNEFMLAMSYHTSGEVIYWADTDTHYTFEGEDSRITNNLYGITGYAIMPVSKDPGVFGSGFENWFKKKYNRFAACIELSPMSANEYIQQPDEKFYSLVWQKAAYIAPQVALDAIETKDRIYDVYQGNLYLKSFYSYNKAVEYAKLWEYSRVMFKNQQVFGD